MANSVIRLSKSPFFWIPLLVALVAFSVRLKYFFTPKSRSQQQNQVELKLFTVEELALHNGTDESLPILLGILGSVFDVTKGKSHYGVGGGYNHFAGRDASRAFVSGNFTGDGLTDSLRELSSTEHPFGFLIMLDDAGAPLDPPGLCLLRVIAKAMTYSQVKSVVEWRGFYFKTYKLAGKLVGRYYDNEGNPTKILKGVETKAARGAQLLEKQKNEEAKLANCNSRWSQAEGGEVWCEDGFPRLVHRPLEIAITGKISKLCACFSEDQLGQPGLEVYEGCDYLAKTCQV